MYVTRPLSLYRASPGAASEPPPEGPHSGYLVAQDEEYEAQAACCWGMCKNPYLSNLPFPQNRRLAVEYTTEHTTGVGEHHRNRHTSTYDVFFVPVPGQPLSSNRYYVVRAKGKHAGNVCTCSTEEDKTTCCFCSCITDVNPTAFDYADIYQQVEVVPRSHRGEFSARAVAPDGFTPHFLRRKGWRVYTSLPRHPAGLDHLGEAAGVDAHLRSRMPDTNFPVSAHHSPAVVVGKWYSPFVFLKEQGCPPKEQMRRSMYYEVTLEQFWEAIDARESPPGEGKTAVQVSADVRGESALLRGCDPVVDGSPVVVDGVAWFRAAQAGGGGVGLSLALVERMRWEQARGGWVAPANGGAERVERVEEYKGVQGWIRFGCSVLVERFSLKRMDGSLLLTFDFKHVDKVIAKWEDR